ncbi:hypothetical protein BKA70DRAFT_1446263 [Coprinopsis sp. MPI-PUGE-AT-0042]|nr:hypothetical protein BKA70DRAFT_1446263 [Coprinopsis sp. MPI-PUGE-AT-0042]
MSSNKHRASNTTPRQPVVERRTQRRFLSSGNAVLSTPFTLRRSASEGTQRNGVLLPISRIVIAPAPPAASAEAFFTPLRKGQKTIASTSYSLPHLAEGSHPFAADSQLPSAPVGNWEPATFGFGDPRSPRSGSLEYVDPPSPTPQFGALNNTQGQIGGSESTASLPTLSPHARAEIRRGKQPELRSAPKLASPFDAALVQVTSFGQTTGWMTQSDLDAFSSGSTTESEPSVPRPPHQVPGYEIVDSDNSSSSANSSNSFTTPPQEPVDADGDFSVGLDDSASDEVEMGSVESMIESLDRMPRPPSPHSDIVTEHNHEPSRFREDHSSLGPVPSFMASSQAASAGWDTPSHISIGSSSEEPESPQAANHTTRSVTGGRAPFREKPLGNSLAKSIKIFDPVNHPVTLLFNVANPGPGITEKELANILHKCRKCHKCLYSLHLSSHFCDKLAFAAINEKDFSLNRYLSSHNNVIGIAVSQFKDVFVRCDDCDRIFWRRKVDEHVCPRYKPTTAVLCTSDRLKGIDKLLCKKNEECFARDKWMEVMESDGMGFKDGEKVEFVSLECAAPLSNLTRSYDRRINLTWLLRWIGKRWISICQDGGFDALEGWALKETSNYIEVPLEDLFDPNPKPSSAPRSNPLSLHHNTSQWSKHRRPVSQHPHTSRIDTDSDAASSMRVSLLTHNTGTPSSSRPTRTREGGPSALYTPSLTPSMNQRGKRAESVTSSVRTSMSTRSTAAYKSASTVSASRRCEQTVTGLSSASVSFSVLSRSVASSSVSSNQKEGDDKVNSPAKQVAANADLARAAAEYDEEDDGLDKADDGRIPMAEKAKKSQEDNPLPSLDEPPSLMPASPRQARRRSSLELLSPLSPLEERRAPPTDLDPPLLPFVVFKPTRVLGRLGLKKCSNEYDDGGVPIARYSFVSSDLACYIDNFEEHALFSSELSIISDIHQHRCCRASVSTRRRFSQYPTTPVVSSGLSPIGGLPQSRKKVAASTAPTTSASTTKFVAIPARRPEPSPPPPPLKRKRRESGAQSSTRRRKVSVDVTATQHFPTTYGPPPDVYLPPHSQVERIVGTGHRLLDEQVDETTPTRMMSGGERLPELHSPPMSSLEPPPPPLPSSSSRQTPPAAFLYHHDCPTADLPPRTRASTPELSRARASVTAAAPALPHQPRPSYPVFPPEPESESSQPAASSKPSHQRSQSFPHPRSTTATCSNASANGNTNMASTSRADASASDLPPLSLSILGVEPLDEFIKRRLQTSYTT